MSFFIWTNIRIDRAKKMRESGTKLKDVAKTMGTTTGSVSAALHRHKLKIFAPSFREEKPFILKNGKKFNAGIVEEKKVKTDLPPPTCPNKPFEKLEKNECQYPIGPLLEKSSLFCSEKILGHGAFCDYHHSICYIRVKKEDDKNE